MRVRFRRRVLAVLVVVVLASLGMAAAGRLLGWGGSRRLVDATFVVKPYLQLGNAGPSTLELLWQGHDREESWTVEVQGTPTGEWAKTDEVQSRRVALEGSLPRRFYRATLSKLEPGSDCAYRVRLGERVVFEARARAPRPSGASHRFVAFGDGGAGTAEQRAVAYQIGREQPDLVVITGDIAYMNGRLDNYDEQFFPVYNSDENAPGMGAPLMRSVPFFAAVGNHDMVYNNLDKMPDGLAYFLVWFQPLNGPALDPNSPRGPTLTGSESHVRAFREAAGPAYPRMANFSFDYGDVHWIVLDANTYADFNAPVLREWLARDLAAAQGAAWRFVAFHHPPFSSSKAHEDDQRTRLLSPLFEQGGVNIVFTGHVHNYQRTYPLRFIADKDPERGTAVVGRWELDRVYDGISHTRPNGVIYVVTGAGGAKLYDTHLNDEVRPRIDFTARFISNVHSLTVVDVEPSRVTVRQVSDKGKALDRFVLTK